MVVRSRGLGTLRPRLPTCVSSSLEGFLMDEAAKHGWSGLAQPLVCLPLLCCTVLGYLTTIRICCFVQRLHGDYILTHQSVNPPFPCLLHLTLTKPWEYSQMVTPTVRHRPPSFHPFPYYI